MAKKKKDIERILRDVKVSKAKSREAQIESGLSLKPKSWGGKKTPKEDRRANKKRMQKDLQSDHEGS